SEEPPCGWRHLPGAGGSPTRAPHRARDALAHAVLARSQREVDGGEAVGRGGRGIQGRRQCDEEEGRHASHGRGEQGVRALSLVKRRPRSTRPRERKTRGTRYEPGAPLPCWRDALPPLEQRRARTRTVDL